MLAEVLQSTAVPLSYQNQLVVARDWFQSWRLQIEFEKAIGYLVVYTYNSTSQANWWKSQAIFCFAGNSGVKRIGIFSTIGNPFESSYRNTKNHLDQMSQWKDIGLQSWQFGEIPGEEIDIGAEILSTVLTWSISQ